MATATRRTLRRPQTVTAGPWKGVRTTVDPFDDAGDQLVDARNCYLPDPAGGCGVYARPGFTLQNASSRLNGSGQGIHCHVALSGTTYNFVVAGGKLYRTDATLSTFTDVTPAGGVTIDATARVYFTTFNDHLIVSDGVNRPWIASNLSSTPITGTAINYDGAGGAWSAFGQPVAYAGSLIFILNTVSGTSRRTDIAWSAPGDPATGYQQANYDYNWTLVQTGSTPLYALAATNLALYYFRDRSIGALTGTPGPNFQGQATHDAIAVNVGCLQSATIAQYGTTIFFCDAFGRPWMLPMGEKPQPIWLDMRAVVDAATTGYPSVTQQVACAVIDPTLSIYLAAIWSPVPSVVQPPTTLTAFDCRTGAYLGQWTVAHGIAIEALGVLNDSAGRGGVALVGSKVVAPASGGYVWVQGSIVGDGTPLTEELSTAWLVTEDGIALATENTTVSWLDNGAVPDISATIARLGYDADAVFAPDRCTVIAGSDAPCTVTLSSAAASATLEGTPSPASAADGMYRLVCGADMGSGRGLTVTVQPTTAMTQWNLQRVSATGTLALAGVDEA